MADLKQVRYQRPDTSYTDDLRTFADASLNLTDALPSGTKRRLLDSLGRVIAEIDETTGDIVRTRHNDAADGPRHALMHESASPAVDDVIGRFAFQARNDAGSIYTGVELRALVKNATAGSEEVWFEAGMMNGGTFEPAGLSLRVVGGAVKLFIDGVEAGTGGGGGALSACVLTHSGNFSVPASSQTPQLFDTEIEDDSGWHSVVSNTSRVTVDQDGLFLCTATVLFDSNSINYREAFFGIDGSTSIRHGADRKDNSASGPFLNPTTVVRLVSGQYLELFLSQNSPVDLNSRSTAGAPRFSVIRIGP